MIQKNKEHCLLYHREYISGFGKDMKMAMWSSYTVPNPVSLEPGGQWATERFELYLNSVRVESLFAEEFTKRAQTP